jgi:hypothetical protein
VEDISLAWDTFDFYASLISKKEGVFEKMTNRSHEFLSTSKISDRNKAYLKEIIELSDILSNDYRKQNLVLIDLIKIYNYKLKNGIAIPIENDVSVEYLLELKDLNENLLKELKIQKNLFLDFLS